MKKRRPRTSARPAARGPGRGGRADGAAKPPSAKPAPPEPAPLNLEEEHRELRLKHDRLEISRDHYANLYDYAPVGYVTLDDKGVIHQVNRTAATMLGLEASHLIGWPFTLYVVKDDQPAFRKHLRELAAPGDVNTAELALNVKGGGETPVEVRGVVVVDAERKTRQVRLTLIDIGRRKAAEGLLHFSLQRLELALAGAELAMWERDLRGNKVVVCPNWDQLLGYTVAEVSDGSCAWQTLVHPEDLPRVNAAVAGHAAGKTPIYEAEYRLRAKSGAWRWVLSRGKIVARDAAGKPLRMAGTYLDIDPRRQAEEALRNNEARLRAILETAAEGIITIDERGVIELFNAAAERIFGYSSAETIGQNLDFLMPEPFSGEDQGYLSRYLQTGVRKIIGIGREVVGRRKNGEVFPLDLSVSEVALADRRIFTGFVRDITERKRSERALEENRALLQAVIDSASDLIYVKDMAGRYRLINRSAERFVGKSAVESLGKDDVLLFPGAEAARLQAFDRQVIADGNVITIEEVLTGAAGKLTTLLTTKGPLLDAQGQAFGLFGISRDITERKRAEQALQESRALLQAVIDGTSDSVFVKDLEGRYRLLNRSAEQFLGRSAAEVLGQDDRCLFPTAEAALMMESDRRIIRDGKVRTYEDVATGAGGDVNTFLTTKGPLLDHEGRAFGVFGISRDITERTRAEQALHAAHEGLQFLSRKLIETQETDRRTLARNLHDGLGQTLTATKIRLQSLIHFPDVKGFKAGLEECVDVLDQVLQQVRQFSLELRPPLLDDMGLGVALRWMGGQQAACGFALELAVPDDLPRYSPEVEITLFRIAQEALTNVVRHARAGLVTVSLRVKPGALEMIVADDGAGYDVAAARARASQGGSLGVLGMEERAQLMGGWLTIESRPGQGTRVQAWLPAAPRPDASAGFA